MLLQGLWFRAAFAGMAMQLTCGTPLAAQPARPLGTPRTVGEIPLLASRAAENRQSVALRALWTNNVRRAPGDRASRLGLAALDFNEYRFARAESLYVNVIAAPPSDDAIAAHAWLGRAALAGQQGRLQPADSMASTALALGRRLRDSSAIFGALQQLAQYRIRTQGAQAAFALLATADSFVMSTRPDAAANIACVRARVRIAINDTMAYADAARGVALIQRGPGRRVRASCQFTMGQVFFGRGERFVDSSARYFRLAAIEQAALGDIAGRAASLQWMGAALKQAGRYSAARSALVEALAESDRSRNRSAGSWAELNLGQLLMDLGDEPAGATHLMRAAAAFSELGDRIGYAAAQISLAQVRLRRGDTSGVAATLPGIEATMVRLGDRLARQRSLVVQVDLARVRGDRARARALAEELWEQFERDKQGTGGSYAFVRGVAALEAGALDVAASHFPVPDRKVLGSERGYVLLARAAEIAARRGDLDLAERRLREAHVAFAEFRSTITEVELRQTSFRGFGLDQVDPDLGVATVINALAMGGRAPAAFGLASDRRARELTDALMRSAALSDGRAVPSIARARATEAAGSDSAVRAALGETEAMLLYVTGDRQEPTTVFVVTRQRVAAATVMSADSLRPLVARLRRLIEGRDGAEALRRQLGTAVLGPASRLIPPTVTRLLIVGDGPLKALPFDVLRLPDGRALLEAYDVALLASPAILPILRGRPQPLRAGTLAMALEDPGRPSPITGRAMPVLRRANAEVSGVAQRSGGVVLVGDAAREATLYQRSDRVAVLHIAAHAVVDPVMESRSAIMLAGGGGQDGDVHAWELDDVRIAAGLVVLSACRTGQSDTDRSEGLRGFTAPMLLSGAQAVVATQWDLSDRAAADMMREFHRQLRAGTDVGAALRSVKLAQLRQGRPPADWAVFQVIGDPAYRITSPR